jgi:hypothetical protein
MSSDEHTVPKSANLPFGPLISDDETSTLMSGSTDQVAPSAQSNDESSKQAPKVKRSTSIFQDSFQAFDKVVKGTASEFAAELGLTKQRSPRPKAAAVRTVNSNSSSVSSSSSNEAPQSAPFVTVVHAHPTATFVTVNASKSSDSVTAKIVTREDGSVRKFSSSSILYIPADDMIRPFAREKTNDLLLEEARHVKRVAKALRNMRFPILPVVKRDKTASVRSGASPTDIEVEAMIDSVVPPATVASARTGDQIKEWLTTLITHDPFFPGMMMVSAEAYDNMTEEQVADKIVEQGVLGKFLCSWFYHSHMLVYTRNMLSIVSSYRELTVASPNVL